MLRVLLALVSMCVCVCVCVDARGGRTFSAILRSYGERRGVSWEASRLGGCVEGDVQRCRGRETGAWVS